MYSSSLRVVLCGIRKNMWEIGGSWTMGGGSRGQSIVWREMTMARLVKAPSTVTKSGTSDHTHSISDS